MRVSGSGGSRRAAEQSAAKLALEEAMRRQPATVRKTKAPVRAAAGPVEGEAEGQTKEAPAKESSSKESSAKEVPSPARRPREASSRDRLPLGELMPPDDGPRQGDAGSLRREPGAQFASGAQGTELDGEAVPVLRLGRP